MTGFLSIIWRELSVGARQKATHRARLIAAGIMMAIFMVILFFSNLPQQYLGPTLFGVTYFILYLQALFSGIRLTADCLSEEKREGTLGLLYLSGLRGSGIVLGKMAVRSLRGIYSLIATLPIFGFCILMGGIQGADAITACSSLLVTMFLSLSIGVLVSSVATDEKAVFAGVVGILAALCIIPYLLWWLILFVNPAATWADYFLWLSPWPGDRDYWKQTSFDIFFAVALLIASVWFLNRSFKKQFTASPRSTNKKTSGAFKSRVNEQLDKNPILWLLNLDSFSAKIAKAHFIVALLMMLVVAFASSRATAFAMGPVVILYGFHLVWKLLVLSDALRRLHHDHRSGALELLLTTPIDPNEILKTQTLRTSRVFFPAAIILTLANLAWYMNDNFDNDLYAIPIGGAIILFIDGAALRWTAMAQAFKPNRFPAAVMRLAAKIIFLPILAFWLFLISGRGFMTGQIGFIFFFWFFVCGIYDFILIKRAKTTLQNLRLLASSEPAPVKPDRRPLPKILQWLLLTEQPSSR